MKQVTILILTWKNLDLLERCINSLQKQTFKSYNLLVYANGSNDRTINFLKKKKISYYRNLKNKGTVEPFNYAAKKIKTKFIVFLNDDTEVDRNWLKNLFISININRNISSVDSLITYKSMPGIIWSAGSKYSIFGKSKFRKQGKKKDKQKKISEEIFSGVGTAIIYRNFHLKKIDYINPNIYLSHEDLDLGMKFNLLNYNNLICNKARVLHHVSATTKIGSNSYVFNSQRSVEINYLVNLPTLFLIIFFFPHLIFIILGFLKFSFQKKTKIFLKAKISVYKDLYRYLKIRKKVQKIKRIKNIDYAKKFFF